jgi:hypothetical protein
VGADRKEVLVSRYDSPSGLINLSVAGFYFLTAVLVVAAARH